MAKRRYLAAALLLAIALSALEFWRIRHHQRRAAESARDFFARGAYAGFLEYDKSLRKRYTSDEIVLYRAAALATLGRLDEATAALLTLDEDDVDPKKLRTLTQAIADRRRGAWPYVADRHGRRIALDIDFAIPDSIETTIDWEVQRAAVDALRGYRASLVAIDPRTNEVLAIANERVALEKQYEPGSVVKILTAAAASDLDSMFPYRCSGALSIDGRSFGDWKEGGHGVLPNFEEAMAQSCNVLFADLGLRAGRGRLHAIHERAGFDGQASLGVFDLPLGRMVGKLFNNFETAFYAIGLEHETTTTFHLAMLASMMANRGTLTTPRIYRTRRSIFGEAVMPPLRQSTAQVMPREKAERIIAGMRAVVASPEGTGRRAAVEGVTMAMKTGTAGKREEGYDALIVAFAPVENPRFAFALIAENAGPAELAAAKMAHDFLERAAGGGRRAGD